MTTQNDYYADQINRRLWAGVRKVTEKAAGNVIQSLIVNTWHDSSNAAFNWNFEVNGSFEGYENYKGKSPVGREGDKRSINGSTAISTVASVKMNIEKKGLYAHLFSQPYSEAMPRFDDFSIVNPVGDFQKNYEYNAGIVLAGTSSEVKRVWDLNIIGWGNYFL